MWNPLGTTGSNKKQNGNRNKILCLSELLCGNKAIKKFQKIYKVRSNRTFYLGGWLTFASQPSFTYGAYCTIFSLHFCAKLPIDFFPKLCYNDYRKQERCSLVERIPPCVPPHPFEPGSPSFGLCLRLGRQRDDVRSSRTADKIL